MLENEVAGTDVLQRVENLEREIVQLLIQNKNLKKESDRQNMTLKSVLIGLINTHVAKMLRYTIYLNPFCKKISKNMSSLSSHQLALNSYIMISLLPIELAINKPKKIGK